MIKFIWVFILSFSTNKIFPQKNFIDSIRTKYRLVGLTYSVFNDARIFESGALGKTNINDTILITTLDRFHLGSNTKAVTAFIAAKLVEEHKIKWDTKFFDLFPYLKASSKKAYWTITLQDLLSHRAHIHPYRSVNANFNDYKIAGNSIEQKIAFAKTVLQQEPAYPDSAEVYVYSNAGYALAASMMEKVTHKSWEQLITKYINVPLKVNFKIGFPNAADPTQPWGHILNNDTIIGLPPEFDYHIATIMRPAGDLNVNIIDYTKFIQLYLIGYRGKTNYLKAGTYKYLLTALPSYTFGWANKTINGHNYNYHSGSAATFGCFTKIDRSKSVAAIVMVNYGDDEALKAIPIIADYLLKKYSEID
jgi:CubicO group peptidase (beta-lactamase class C family)